MTESTEVDESDIEYMCGRIDGVVAGLAFRTVDTSFDQDEWQSLYGEPVVYDSFPAYPTREAARNREKGILLMRWEDSTETSYLKDGAEIPDDRNGVIVFENGYVVARIEGRRMMFTVSDSVLEYIAQLRESFIETVRDVYSYYD